MEFADEYMQEAFVEAEKALEIGEVPVGCVFVDINDNNKIVARGCNSVNASKNATRHAELNCVDQFLAQHTVKDFSHVAVYVNVEPCIMCASALIDLKVGAIFFGCRNERFGGCRSVLNVADLLSHTSSDTTIKPVIQGGFRNDEAIVLLKQFYKGENPNAPEDKRKPAR
jgi:tRNA-specific adenosine deaminase 2